MKYVFISLLAVLTACSHPLEIKNLAAYQPTHKTFAKDLAIGVTSVNSIQNGRKLVDGVAHSLRFYSQRVFYPALPGQHYDLLADISISSRHKGSLANFFISFPGFLVWAPAWNGYVYHPGYDINIDLRQGDQIVDSFTVPVDLNVRHAELDRTWTELAWLEVGALAFVGGIVFTSYDQDVTPEVERAAQQQLGNYLAQEILRRTAGLQPIHREVARPAMEPETTESSGVYSTFGGM